MLGGGACRNPGLENLNWNKRAESSYVTQEPWGREGPCPYMSGLGGGTGHINDMLALWGSSLSALALPSTCGSLIPSMSVGRWISTVGALRS